MRAGEIKQPCYHALWSDKIVSARWAHNSRKKTLELAGMWGCSEPCMVLFSISDGRGGGRSTDFLSPGNVPPIPFYISAQDNCHRTGFLQRTGPSKIPKGSSYLKIFRICPLNICQHASVPASPAAEFPHGHLALGQVPKLLARPTESAYPGTGTSPLCHWRPFQGFTSIQTCCGIGQE